jgi:predicted HTH domain antitoxin
MGRITFEIPEHSLDALNLPCDELAMTLRMAAAVKLYEMERLSSGAAAELAGVPKPLFLARLAEFGVDTFRLSEEELLREAPLG